MPSATKPGVDATPPTGTQKVTSGPEGPPRSPSLARSGPTTAVDVVIKRYQPALIAFAVMFTIVELASPLHLSLGGASPVLPAFQAGTSAVAAPANTAPPRNSVSAAGALGLPVASGPATASPTGSGNSTAVASSPALGPLTSPTAGAALPPVGQPGGVSTSPGFGQVTVASTTPLPGAGGVAVAGDGSYWVTLSGAGGRGVVAHLSEGGSVERRYTLPASQLTGVALGSSYAYVTAQQPAEILRLDPTSGATSVYATIPTLQPCLPVVSASDCSASPGAAAQPWAMAFDRNGNLYVTDTGQGAIWRVPPGGGAAVEWLVDTDFASLSGSSGPTGIAIDPAGDVIFTVPSTMLNQSGVVYLQHVDLDGSPGTRQTIAQLGTDQHPDGLALARGGDIYLSLPGTSQILVLNHSGKQIHTVNVSTTLGAGDLTGLAFSNSYLLATGRSPAGAARGTVVSVTAEPGGVVYLGR